MNVFLDSPQVASPSLRRVANALKTHLPDSITVTNEKEADLVVLHTIGRQEQITERAFKLKAAGKKYIVIQYAIRSTLRPHTLDWIPLWEGAEFVWSYYDLKALCREDGVISTFSFYHAPLGVDDSFEKPRGRIDKRFLIAATGQSYLTEGVRECIIAADGLPVFHLGKELKRPNVTCETGITDTYLSELYAASAFVSGLRRIEGFELPVIEGLVCGARPIVFDKPHYRQWFNDYAIFIPEAPREEVIESLRKVFSKEYIPVTQREILQARATFNWKRIIKEFWERVI